VGAYLAFKETWRHKGRFFLFSLVIALITTLILFIAGLAEGLGSGNREYLEKLNGEILVYQAKVDLSITASQIDLSKLNDIRRIKGVSAVGPLGFSRVAVGRENPGKLINTTLIGVEPGKPGEPPAIEGQGLRLRDGKDTIIDRNVALETGLRVGDTLIVKSIQDNKEKYNQLRIVGVTTSQKYSIQPSIFVPFQTWEKIRPQASAAQSQGDLTANIVAVRLEDAGQQATVMSLLEKQVRDIQAVDRVTAYEATPGYSAQKSTLDTQENFALLIGVLVIGGFFQIQTLQKVAQIGMLKAIGIGNGAVALAALIQIIIVTVAGVFLGSIVTQGLSLILPANIPIVFTARNTVAAIASLLIIGPLGGLVSIRYSLRIEPLTALGLAS
jgi:putative ABC transport system permease protein